MLNIEFRQAFNWPLRLLWMAALLLLSAHVGAAAPADPTSIAPLQPFTATYRAYVDGRDLGRAVTTLTVDRGNYVYTTTVEASGGIGRLAGLSMQQVARFDIIDGRPRLQSALFERRHRLGVKRWQLVCDWQQGEARWVGDVDEDQRGPVPIAKPAINSHLASLVTGVALQAAPGLRDVDWRVLERGALETARYRVAGAETIDLPAGAFVATRVNYSRTGSRHSSSAWYAPSQAGPVPVKLQQDRDGQEHLRLELISLERN